MALVTERLLLRPWREGDQEALCRVADNENVSRWLADRFPYPYTRGHADGWIRFQESIIGPPPNLAITKGGEVLGGVGLDPLRDVYRIGAETGYWLAESAWGHGYASEAMQAYLPYVWERFDFQRLQAHVYAPNTASVHVLEKLGFVCEGRLSRAVIKRGEVLDVLMYALLRPGRPG